MKIYEVVLVVLAMAAPLATIVWGIFTLGMEHARRFTRGMRRNSR
jgi:hypothetical protein